VPTGADTQNTSESAQSGGTLPTGAATNEAGAANVPTDARLAELRDEVKFLRSALEARDRDAAELRAALREALKMSNRALPAGYANAEVESAPQASQRAENAPAGNPPPPVPNGAQTGSKRDARPLWKVILGVR
jgi:hypothetical protein